MRKAINLSQTEIADRCNVSQGAVSRWEAGEYPIPRKYWKFLCPLFGCTRDQLNDAINETMRIAQ